MRFEHKLMSALCENALTSKSGDTIFGDLELHWDSAIIKDNKGNSVTLTDVRFKMELSTDVSRYTGTIYSSLSVEVITSNGVLMRSYLREEKDRVEFFRICEQCVEAFEEANKSVNQKVWDILDNR